MATTNAGPRIPPPALVVPPVSLLVLAVALVVHPTGPGLLLVAAFLGAAVLCAVHHAEVVARKVGEPFGSLVLAVAVTGIEVALIVTLMVSGGKDTSTLARDTVFAAVMITTNGIMGLSLLLTARRHHTAIFNPEGTGAALATVGTLSALCLVFPTFTTARPGPEYSGAQLTFAAVASLLLYGLFVVTQTVRHRDFFLPVTDEGSPLEEQHADPPRRRPHCSASGCCWCRSWPWSGWPRWSRRRSRRASPTSASRRPSSAW